MCYFALTVTIFGLTSSALGSVMVKMPSSNSAFALSETTEVGSITLRTKLPPTLFADVVILLLRLVLFIHLAFDTEYIASDIDLNIIRLHAKQSRFHDHIVVNLINVKGKTTPTFGQAERTGGRQY